jgi:hypothetical protein
MKALAIALLFPVLAGCETVRYQLIEKRVPVPIPCEEKVPAPPAWATETARPKDLVEKVGTLEAEIEQRRGYEEVLIGTIRTCRHEK